MHHVKNYSWNSLAGGVERLTFGDITSTFISSNRYDETSVMKLFLSDSRDHVLLFKSVMGLFEVEEVIFLFSLGKFNGFYS